MYCPKCGTQIEDGSSFCISCGSKITVIASNQETQHNYVSPLEQRINIRKSECEEIEKMIPYFSQKQDTYDEYDKTCAQLKPVFSTLITITLTLGIVSLAIGSLTLLISYSCVGNEQLFGSRFFPAIIFILIGLGSIAMCIVFKKLQNNYYQKTIRRINELSSELYQHYKGYGYCTVSAEYTNPSILRIILKTIESGRADTIKEAINILLENAHRNQMEEYARRTAISAAYAASSASTAAFFSGASFFLK